MVQLLDLSVELHLSIAAYLRQVDLLNVSLVCKHLRATTEPELFREYRNRRLGNSHPISKFVLRILQKPTLTRYVKSVNVKGYDTLDSVDPVYDEINPLAPPVEDSREKKEVSFMEDHAPEPTEEEYALLVKAAINAGAITSSFSYEQESSIIKNVKSMLSSDAEATFPNSFYTYLFDDTTPMGEIPYSQRFCQLLRAGIDDAYAMLLFSILPNVDDIFLRGAMSDPTALEWPTPKHGFKALRRLRAAGVDGQLAWGIGYLNTILSQTSNLTELLLHNVASWYKGKDYELSPRERAKPVVLQPNSLNVTNLQMCSCALDKIDMRNLINACPKLTHFQYYTGTEETGPFNFSALDLVEILDPLRHTLEELAVDILPYWDDDLDGPRIISMSQFTALKSLDTSPFMWEHMVDSDFDMYGDTVEEEHRLSRRVPRSLRTLIFHASELGSEYEEDMMFPAQVHDLLRQRDEWLPHLTMLCFGFKSEANAEELDEILEDLTQEGLELSDLHVQVGFGDSSGGPTRTFMDNESDTGKLPVTKWFAKDGKYAARREKIRAYDVAMTRLLSLPENQYLTDDEMKEVVQRDADVSEALEQIKLNGFPEPVYESEDADED
ncbi:hypothetical protein BKA63DRAFT_520612 [Paraphoma chrysanthemicola]|nr:hypothetical protein BKA63DRAFT_520612 [Paraphoma chrysanthemicola]